MFSGEISSVAFDSFNRSRSRARSSRNLALHAEHGSDLECCSLGALGVERVSLPEHRFLYLRLDDGTYFAEVFADVVDLDSRAIEELQVSLQIPRTPCLLLPPGTNEVVDLDGVMLAIAIDAAVALLQSIRIPRNLVMDESMAVVLKIDTFRRGVGGEQECARRTTSQKPETPP